MKIFLDNKKIPLIPLLLHENHFITNFQEKADLFNSFFSNQCSLLNSCTTLPTNPRYATDKRLYKINFTADNTEKIIVSLNSNKAPGHDNISTYMLKICGDTICKPLEILNKLLPLIFFCLNEKSNIELSTKKATNKTLKITAQFLYFLSAEKLLQDPNLMKCLAIFWLTIP